jgi:hypothetical protein
MRTALEIFEEVLDAWDERVVSNLMMIVPPAALEASMEAHLADVRKYREEFREAMWTDPVTLSAPEQALADANPSTYPEILPPGQPVKPPRVGPGDHHFRPPLDLTVSGTPPTLDAEILTTPPLHEPQVLGGLRRLMEADASRHYGVSPDATQANRGTFSEPDPAVDPELLQALKDGLEAAHKFRRESVAERSERLAERYTRDDGSSR